MPESRLPSQKSCLSSGRCALILKTAVVLVLAGLVYAFAPLSMGEAARRTLFVFAAAALFWSLEIIPLYATSLGAVVLLILLLARPGGVMGMSAGGYETFLLPLGDPVIILFFGGFVLARALGKYGIDRIAAAKMIRFFGTRPYTLMCGFLMTTAFLSMWMSNTATTAMMMGMILPLLKQMKADDPFRTALALAIPFAANIGGIATPVGTPPNAIAIGFLMNEGLHMSFISWMIMALPLMVIVLAAVSGILYLMYPPSEKRLHLDIQVPENPDPRSRTVAWIALATILLWLTSGMHHLPSSLIALIAAGILFGTRLLDRDDLKNIEWDVLVLMWGGLALGKAVEISGLSHWVISLPVFQQQGFWLAAVFCGTAVLLSTFMSNTATANLMIPIALAVPGENHVLLAVVIALSCSFAMALPISTPPNAIAFASGMLKSRDMLKSGALIAVMSVLIVLFGFRFVIGKSFGLP